MKGRGPRGWRERARTRVLMCYFAPWQGTQVCSVTVIHIELWLLMMMQVGNQAAGHRLPLAETMV